MRLINTETLEPHNLGSEKIPEYAILSHRWQSEDGGEATLQELQEFLSATRAAQDPSSSSHATELARMKLQVQRLEDLLERVLETLREVPVGQHDKAVRFVKYDDIVPSKSPHESTPRNLSPQPVEPVHTLPVKPGMQKVIDFCRTAKSSGYEWAWIDTVCIDKTNNVELSESINSMWKWYQDAKVCFVHLHDVHSRDEPRLSKYLHDRRDPNLIDGNQAWIELRASSWFTRGWTLQELIAPSFVVFYNSTWSVLGTRESLRHYLSSLTNVPSDVLRDPARLPLYTSAQRMSWAANRITTRAEDTAYCLLGLFNVNMELLYGEGAIQAFQRLQTKILEEYDDETLLTWEVLEDDLCARETALISQPHSGQRLLPAACALTGFLAQRPRQFWRAGDIADSDHYLPDSPLEITSWGIKLEREVYELSDSRMQWKGSDSEDATTSRDPTTSITLVPLSCGPTSWWLDHGSYIAVVRDRTAKFENRLCRLHLLGEQRYMNYITHFLRNERHNKVLKRFFVRMSWPVDTDEWRHDPVHSRRQKQIDNSTSRLNDDQNVGRVRFAPTLKDMVDESGGERGTLEARAAAAIADELQRETERERRAMLRNY